MTVEQLIFDIPPQFQSSFVELDEQIWTPYLSSFAFFVSKEVWTCPANPSYLSIIVRWSSQAEWKSIPVDKLMELSREFDKLSQQKFGEVFAIKQSLSYEVEKL
ncbi:MAG: TIGR03792 family protein [Candidatus Parcubacteria bacterium]|nr:TIGR03792 family protein [Candidatus Paceibacterota bacterium]